MVWYIMHKLRGNTINEIGNSNRECRLTLSNGMWQPSSRKLAMPKTEESCKTGTSQDFKRRTHQYIHFVFLVISVVRLWLLYHNKAPWNYQVLMVASREFWPFFLTEYATCKIGEWCFKGGAQWWRSNTSESCLYKNPKRLSSVRQGLSQNPKRLLKSEQSTVGGEVDKNMMWAQITFQQCSHNVCI